MTSQGKHHTRNGFFAAVIAFFLWGVLPVYWKLLQHVSPMEVLLHRIVWSMIFLSLLVTVTGRWGEVLIAISSGRSLLLLLCSGLVIGGNWLTFIWAVNSDRILEASLGYYINPLLFALCGFLFFREQLSRLQALAVLLAIAAVANMIISYGEVPEAAILLASTFVTYGMLRKYVSVAPIPGLLIETTMLGLPMAGYIAWQAASGSGAFLFVSRATDICLVGAGVVTSVPLLLFIIGARRLRFITIGIMQYIGPTVSFFIGMLMYGEPFTIPLQVTFAVIWAVVLLYCVESIRVSRQASEPASTTVPAPHRIRP
jgi:chloramphenicol-sensitive protein RarD